MGKIRAETIRKNPNTIFAAVYEQGALDESAVGNEVTICHSFEHLMEQDLDAIFVCAFNNVAAHYTASALEKGLHVFCEKPPAKDTKQLEDVMNVEASANRILKYGFNHRLHYSVMQAKSLIESGEMGKLLWIRGVYGKAGSIDYHDNWRNYKNYSAGGILMDQGIHMLDLMHHFTGYDFEVMSSQLTTSYWDVEVEDNAFVTLKSGDVIATLHSSATQWRHKFLMEMCFEHGFVNLDGILSDSRSYAPETLVVSKREFEDVTFAMGKPAESTTWFENDDSWKFELEEFVQAIKHKQQITHGTSFDAHKVLDLVERIYLLSGFYDER